jgi:tetratricopeptide (TPR) repeat protein
LDGAIALFRRAAALDPSLGLNPEADAHEAAAHSLVGSGDLTDILAHLQAARDADPHRDLVLQRDTLIGAGQWLSENNRDEEALKALDAAQSLAPAAPVPAIEWNRV